MLQVEGSSNPYPSIEKNGMGIIKTDEILADRTKYLKFDGLEADLLLYIKKLTQSELHSCEGVDFAIRTEPIVPRKKEQQSIWTLALDCCHFCPEDCCCITYWMSCILLVICWPLLCCVFYCKDCDFLKPHLGDPNFKRKVEDQTYNELKALFGKIKVNKIKLLVHENFLGKEKIQLLKQFVESSGAKQLYFRNAAIAHDAECNEWEQFEQNIEPITKIANLKYHFVWEYKEFKNFQ